MGDWGNQWAPGETSGVPAILTVYFWLLKYLCGSLSLGNINSHNSITLTLISLYHFSSLAVVYPYDNRDGMDKIMSDRS